jgi:uroporphyrin-III C-methyltransferase / precorrin-2 dehydrogenase / sirohydrochlorin ferrochelatase
VRHFPIFLDLRGRRVAVAGGGEIAVAKLRLVLKTEARINVAAAEVCDQIRRWHDEGRLVWHPRPFGPEDAICAPLVYGATGDAGEDARVKRIAEAAGALVNIVDDLENSDFITPAIVDRDPVTVAIGTEGAAPVLARRIKAENEERLAPTLGTLARLGRHRRFAVEALPAGRARRDFWTAYFDDWGPATLAAGGEEAVAHAFERRLADAVAAARTARPGKVVLVGAGPGDPELLTLKARRCLHEADAVIHDRLVAPEILELARREALRVEVGKAPGGPAWKQADIDALLIDQARQGAVVARLKSGDPLVFGRADEEIEALEAAGVAVEIIPGVTSAAAAAASAGRSLTRRGRNRSVTLMTAHDAAGFAEHDWRNLAQPGAIAAVYMGLRAARFVRGRLLVHGAEAERPVTVVENASRTGEKRVATTLGDLPEAVEAAGITGPAIILLGLEAAAAAAQPVTAPAHLGAAS